MTRGGSPTASRRGGPPVIWLVRHGETAGNASRVMQLPETPLSEVGLDQARRLAARLAAEPIGLILSSDLARARRTAECVREVTGAPLELDPDLQERNFGALRGRPYAELGLDPFAPDYVPPGGESWEALHRRIDAAWERIVASAGTLRGDLVVVTHGLVCHSLVSRRLALAPGVEAPRGFANTALTQIDPVPPWRVGLLGCTLHLEGDTAPGAGLQA